ncbi:hypothetical protein CR513_00153, partial [Mucuna pruriens]
MNDKGSDRICDHMFNLSKSKSRTLKTRKFAEDGKRMDTIWSLLTCSLLMYRYQVFFGITSTSTCALDHLESWDEVLPLVKFNICT